MTGLRHGEALGLRWPDFSFDNKELFVDRQLKKIKNGEPIFGPPKNNSKRHVPLPEKLIADVRKWKLACPPSKWNLVFPSKIGGPQHRKSTWNIMDKTTTTANLKEPTRPLKRLRSMICAIPLQHPVAQSHRDRGAVRDAWPQLSRGYIASLCPILIGASVIENRPIHSSLDLHFSKSKASTNDT